MRPLESARLNPADLPQRIWVTDSDHSTVILDAPKINGDTIVGWVAGDYREIPLARVASLRTRERARTRTAVAVTATTVAMLGAFMYLESRRDVGTAPVCLNAAANVPAPFTPCCLNQDSLPC